MLSKELIKAIEYELLKEERLEDKGEHWFTTYSDLSFDMRDKVMWWIEEAEFSEEYEKRLKEDFESNNFLYTTMLCTLLYEGKREE